MWWFIYSEMKIIATIITKFANKQISLTYKLSSSDLELILISIIDDNVGNDNDNDVV